MAHEAFARVAVPPWWRSDFFRALRHFAASDVWDPRLEDAYQLLLSKRIASNPRVVAKVKGSTSSRQRKTANRPKQPRPDVASGVASPASAVRVSVSDIRTLRHALLRPEQPPSASVYPKDDDADTGHFGVYRAGELVGVASVFHDAMPGSADALAWRIRGMATSPSVRGTGCGRLLAVACLEHASRSGGQYVWCNARPEVKGFYGRFGFVQLGKPFDLHGHGTRLKMRCPLPFHTAAKRSGATAAAGGDVGASGAPEGQVPAGWWKLERMQAGKQHFKLEPVGRPSRLVTVQALAVVQWWRAKTGSSQVPSA